VACALVCPAVARVGCTKSQDVSAAEYVTSGAEYYETSDYARAADCFQLAADHPDSAIPQVGSIANTNLATALQNLGRDTEALEAVSRAVKADPSDIESLSMYGKALQKAGHLDEARTWLSKAVKLDPMNARILYSLGTVQQQDVKYREALLMYERSARLDPSYLPPLIQEAIVLSRLNQCTRATSKANLLTQNYPGMQSEMESALASVFSHCDDKTLQLDSYLSSIAKWPGRIVEVGPDTRTNECRAGALLLSLHKPTMAIAYLLKAEAACDPDPARVQALMGFAYTQLGGRYFIDAIHRFTNSSRFYGFLPSSAAQADSAEESAYRVAAVMANTSSSDPSVLANLVRLKYVCSDWVEMEAHLAGLHTLITASLQTLSRSPANPVFVLAYPLVPCVLLEVVAVKKRSCHALVTLLSSPPSICHTLLKTRCSSIQESILPPSPSLFEGTCVLPVCRQRSTIARPNVHGASGDCMTARHGVSQDAVRCGVAHSFPVFH